MKTKSKNRYLENEKKKNALGFGSAESGAVKSKADLGYMILSGLGGGISGVVTGRASLLVGLAVAGGGYFFKSPNTTMFGVGLMASGGYQTLSGAFNGDKQGLFDGMKERFKNLGSNLKHQLFLDVFTKKEKKEDQATNGVQDVQYFQHPGSDQMGSLDFTEANRIEQQLEEAARSFSGADTAEGMGSIEEKLL